MSEIVQKRTQISPTSLMYEPMLSLSPSTAPAMTSMSRIADAMRTGLSIRSANSGERRRIAMPMTTGRRTTAKTCSSLPVCIPRLSSSGAKCEIARLAMSGRVMIASTELMAVRVMFRATSPRKRWL